MYEGTAETTLGSDALRKHQGKGQLVFTSPPFPLHRKKRYGNLLGQQYIDWLAAFALTFRNLICKDGSIPPVRFLRAIRPCERP